MMCFSLQVKKLPMTKPGNGNTGKKERKTVTLVFRLMAWD
jgi:hypothetical protein